MSVKCLLKTSSSITNDLTKKKQIIKSNKGKEKRMCWANNKQTELTITVEAVKIWNVKRKWKQLLAESRILKIINSKSKT